MVPVKLELVNFMSYGSEITEVDFEPYDLICLSGKNGAGKSALLDAITWSLWGRGRRPAGTSKVEHSLMHHGADRMLVSLEFLVGGERYRVRREAALRRGRVKVTLNVEHLLRDRGVFVPVSDAKVRDAQAMIDSILKVSYETFTASVFIRQGGQGEFAKKSPAERKEILAEILGFGVFEILKGEAQERAKELSVEVEYLRRETESLEERLREISERASSAKELGKRLQRLLEREKSLTDDLLKFGEEEKNISEEVTELRVKAAGLLSSKKELERLLAEKRELGNELQKVALELENSGGESIEKLRESVEKLEAEEERLLREAGRKEEELSRKEKEIAELQSVVEKIRQLERELRERVEAKILELSKTKEEAEEVREQIRLALVKSYEIGVAGRAISEVETIASELILFLSNRRVVAESEEGSVRRGLEELAREGEELRKILKEERKKAERLPEEEKKLASLKAEILEKKKRVDELRLMMQKARKRLSEMAASGGKAVQEERVRVLRENEKRLEKRIMELQPAVADFEKIVEKGKAAALRLKKAQEEKSVIERMLAELREEVSRLRGEIRVAEELENQRKRLEKELEAAKNKLREKESAFEDEQLFQKIFGRDGVQAVMMASLVPELEFEANRVLERLSGGVMRVGISLSKDLKSGGKRDTLEIMISDAHATRPYETFSGGEAFRIDFALRLALSRLMLRNAGAHMRTLIIDEGFGSQDPDGMERVISAIHAVREEFDKTIVVSHIPDVRGAFPVQFIVEKGEQGSRLFVSEQ